MLILGTRSRTRRESDPQNQIPFQRISFIFLLYFTLLSEMSSPFSTISSNPLSGSDSEERTLEESFLANGKDLKDFDPKIEVSDHDSDDLIESSDESEHESTATMEDNASEEISCECGRCRKVYMENDDYCCQEATLLENFRGNHGCVLEVDDFQATIPVKTVLWLTSRKGRRTMTNKEYRHCAYKTCARLFGHWRGGVATRYRLPSCVVAEIRRLYPSPNGEYRGFDMGDGACFTYME